MTRMFQSLDLFVLSFLFLTSHTELVKDLKCYVYSSKRTYCSWLPASHTTDLTFSYWLSNEDGTTSHYDPSTSLKECSSYNYTGTVKTGCDLQAHNLQNINISLTGKLNNMSVSNTFKIRLADYVSPPPLNWTVTKTGNKFNISWIPPDVKIPYWKYIINYTECNEIKQKTINDATSTYLDVVPHCHYRMAIQAKPKYGKTETPWSDEKDFDADTDPYVLVYAAILIPLMFAGLAVLTFVYCRKNKEKIFPKVPEPRDLLSDISDNNNKSAVRNLYIPAEEEDNCKITLVIDPQIKKLDP